MVSGRKHKNEWEGNFQVLHKTDIKYGKNIYTTASFGTFFNTQTHTKCINCLNSDLNHQLIEESWYVISMTLGPGRCVKKQFLGEAYNQKHNESWNQCRQPIFITNLVKQSWKPILTTNLENQSYQTIMTANLDKKSLKPIMTTNLENQGWTPRPVGKHPCCEILKTNLDNESWQPIMTNNIDNASCQRILTINNDKQYWQPIYTTRHDICQNFYTPEF